MSVCGACGVGIECPEDDVLPCGHRAHAACLVSRCGGDVEKIVCPACGTMLFGARFKAINGPMMFILYTLLNLTGAWQAALPFLLAFCLVQTHRIINWLL